MHKSAFLFVVLALATISALTGCGRRVQPGQIFIATQGSQNVKLGAVEIFVFDETTINSFVKQKQAEIAQQRDRLRREADTAQNEFQKVEEPYKKAIGKYLDAKGRYNDQADVVRRETEKTKELDISSQGVIADINDYSNKIAEADQQIADVQKDAEKRAAIAQDELTRKEILSRVNYDPAVIHANDDKLYCQTALKELLPKSNELKQRITEQQAVLDTENQKLAKIETEMAEKQKSAKSAEESYYDAQSKLNVANQAITDFIPAQILFKDLPRPVAQIVSDAEGKFRLELPSGGRCAVFAHAQRTVAETESYYWLVWTDGGGDLLLNNANMFGTASSDQVVPVSASEQQ
jgi:predicted nuclease with TOPRIM domain